MEALASRFPTNGEGIPIVALDIDGTLGDYHGHFLRFAEEWLDKRMPPSNEINPGLPLHQFMGIPKHVYRDVKLAYRQGGLKRTMPAYDGASSLTKAIQSRGAQIWICTTRPYLRLDNIDPDTREWLRRNDIRFNAVLFGEDKYQELDRQAGHRVAAIVDDLPEMCEEAIACFQDPQREGWLPRIYLRDQPYNKNYERAHSVVRVDSMESLQEHLLREISGWIDHNKRWKEMTDAPAKQLPQS